MHEPEITSFFDPDTFTVTHIVSDPSTGRTAIIDSVLDYDPKSGCTSHASADKVVKHVQKNGLTVDWLLETHAHADHLSAAPYLKEKLGGKISIGRHICDVQGVFKKVFNLKDLNTHGAEFDQLFDDGEAFKLGSLDVHVMHTPGHTPACLTYIVGKHAFIGDTLFMPDYGSARCDFPGGDAATLYQSIKKVLSLAADTQLHLCHDYPPKEREPAWVSTIAEQRANNIHVNDGVTEAEFVKMRTARDKTLSMPVLILPAIQVNIRAGRLPAPEDNGVVYLKIPVNAL
jgi:glyoxylase-like metal-dependent hydrolase (beta-lactamase superfamily II)